MIRHPRQLRLREIAAVLMLAATTLALPALPAVAQLGGATPAPEELVRIESDAVSLEAGAKGEARIVLRILPTWHINANPPSPDYMIPTELAVEAAGGVSMGAPVYPPPHMVKLGFDDSELFVYDGEAIISLPLQAAADAANGTHVLRGELHFQACNDQVCLAPTSLPVSVRVSVRGGVDAPPAQQGPGAASEPGEGADGPSLAEGGTLDVGQRSSTEPGTSPPVAGTGFTTGPPPSGAGATAAIANPIAEALEKGSLATFVTLFLIGLALNLTPCVYPMLGVTVSIFGSRGAAPPHKAFAMALVYVMGIALMYSSLGLVAAFSGGLFGGALQSPIVLVIIGLLLMGLALSMFGLYEFQVPATWMTRLGGQTATGALGVFASGLLVGIFAAPCIGPPIVALLALVGQKADPVFGFTSFFILSMGLGAPYLVLGTFSNLLQSLPRSGEWMVWVKKVFGVILLAIGTFYALLALAPNAAYWVAPVALLLGGLYLGFIEKSKGRSPVFGWVKRVSGSVAVIAGVFLMPAIMPSPGIAFTDITEGSLETALKTGRPVLVDFSADWCVPCHELERFTFTDERVIDASRAFEAFKVDLTRYDSPRAERWRREYGITGVPTILFLTPEGEEVRLARVEGFLPPEPFLERMQIAATAGQTAER